MVNLLSDDSTIRGCYRPSKCLKSLSIRQKTFLRMAADNGPYSITGTCTCVKSI